MSRPTETWPRDLVHYASASLEAEDRRLRLLYSVKPESIRSTRAICLLNEYEITGVIIAAVASRLFDYGTSLLREKPYPSGSKKRADFAVKPIGRGKNWAYIEVKRYGGKGKDAIRIEAVKLRGIKLRVQRWLLLYRWATPGPKTKSLRNLLKKNYDGYFKEKETYEDSFQTVHKGGKLTNFELVLCRLRRR